MVAETQLFEAHIEEARRRFDEALSRHGYDHVVIFSGSLHIQFLDDRPYPFAANPWFRFWAPVSDSPDSFIVYTPGDLPRLILHRPEDFWHVVPQVPDEAWTRCFRIETVARPGEAKSHMPEQRRHAAFIGEWDDRFVEWGLENVNPEPLLAELDHGRAWKTDYEIACMAQANLRAAAAHRAAESAFRSGAAEIDIHLAYLASLGHGDAGLPYDNIIALNEHGATLHYQKRDVRPPTESRSFLIDAGAQHAGYASDVTRTHAADDGPFRELIQRMDEVQQEICARIRPGLDYRDLHLDAHRRIGELAREQGIVTCSAEAAVEQGITRALFPHGLGHYIGLQTHDVGGLAAGPEGGEIPRPEGHPFLRLTRTVDASQAFTIEPGLYFIPSLLSELRGSAGAGDVDWSVVERLSPFGGVRIEDDVVVTAEGHRNLTREAFAEI